MSGRRELRLQQQVAAAQLIRGQLARLIILWRRALAKLHQRRRPARWTMYDSIDLTQIPADAQAVAGYTGGRWPTYPELHARWPHAHCLSIAVTADEDASCLDVETGDATPQQAPAWVQRQLAAGVRRPCLYGSRSTMVILLPLLRAAGIRRGQIRLWLADPTGHPHLPAGYDACQWWWKALGRNLDQSICASDFFM